MPMSPRNRSRMQPRSAICLYRQLTHPVRWEQSVRAMARDGAQAFLEVGPGKVLQGLIGRTLPGTATSGASAWNDVLQ